MTTMISTEEEREADHAAGQPRSVRELRIARRQAAYRRLAIAILGLDVPTLSTSLRGARRDGGRHALPGGFAGSALSAASRWVIVA